SKAWQVCAMPLHSTLDQVVASDCLHGAQQAPKLSWGFDPRAFWMHVIVTNASDHPNDRLLTIGHPRLQAVTLFELRDGKLVSRRDSGINVPLANKPLPMTRPAFDLHFGPGEHKNLWLRVASESPINLDTELWSPREGLLVEQKLQFFETLALGLMLLCMLYSFWAFMIQRERLMLYFGLFMLSELIVELSRFGLMQLYLWPADQAFDLRIVAIAVACALVSFTLVLRTLLHPIQRFPVLYGIYLITIGCGLAGVGWSLLVDYRIGAQWWTMTLLPAILSVVGLSVSAHRQQQASAKILLQSFSVLLLIEFLRVFTALGLIESIAIDLLATPWAIALATSFILVNMIRSSADIQAALKKTQSESNARLHFMSQMSHELRSPLTTMLGHVKLMRHESMTQPVHIGLQAIWRDAMQLLAMIDDILDYARGSLGYKGLHPLPRTWGQLMEHIKQSADILTQTNNNHLMWSEHGAKETALLVDERRLQQVLNNLLTNAARYTHRGEIRLSCNLQQIRITDLTPNWRLSFSVTDSGEGIALEDQKRIFEPFQRGSKAHLSSHKGMGMGLAIASQLVHSMGGEMSLSSQPGQGSCFSFHVVCAQAVPEDFENMQEGHAFIDLQEDEWQVGKNAVTQPDHLEPARVLMHPTDAQLAILKQLVDNGQLSDLLDWASALEQASPELAAYCRRVRQAAMALDMPMLHNLCSPLNAPCPSSAPPPPPPATAP
ncbi:MAG: hypothetical protein RLZZ371_62, partial [Pseudomonadota bacterium]